MSTQITIGDRWSGKTTKLIKRSAEEGSYILAASKKQASIIFKQAKDMGFDIPYPITPSDILNKLKPIDHPVIRQKGVLIDEGVALFQSILSPVPINEITLTNNDNIAYLHKPNKVCMMPATLDPAVVTAMVQGRQKEKEKKKEEVTTNMDETVMKFTTTVNENLDSFIFETISNFAEERYETKIDKKELVTAITLIRRCKKCNVDILDLTAAVIEMSEKIKSAYEKGYEDGRDHEK